MKKKVLVVEDDRMLLEAIAFRLENKGYEVIKAGNGWEALDIIADSKVDLVISDVMIPNISGLSLLSLLNRFYFDRIPVIMISSLDKGSVIMSALGLGAKDFLVKPLNYDDLVRRVEKLLKTQDTVH